MSTLEATLDLPAPAVLPSETEPAETVVERRDRWGASDFVELWRYRELLYFLTWRDVKVRYKQTVLGAAWALLQPLATMTVFSVFFGRLAKMPSGGIPYPLFVLAGLLPWTFFANAISSAGQSIVGSQSLVTKVYFPRLIIPTASVAAGLVDFAIAFLLLMGLSIYYGVSPGWNAVMLPIAVLGLVLAGLGVGTLLSALTVAYRDFRYIVPFLVQLWMFATPTVYMHADTMLGSSLKAFMPCNPAYGLIGAFRSAVLGTPIDGSALGISFLVSILYLMCGCVYFRRVERSFADIV